LPKKPALEGERICGMHMGWARKKLKGNCGYKGRMLKLRCYMVLKCLNPNNVLILAF